MSIIYRKLADFPIPDVHRILFNVVQNRSNHHVYGGVCNVYESESVGNKANEKEKKNGFPLYYRIYFIHIF